MTDTDARLWHPVAPHQPRPARDAEHALERRGVVSGQSSSGGRSRSAARSGARGGSTERHRRSDRHRDVVIKIQNWVRLLVHPTTGQLGPLRWCKCEHLCRDLWRYPDCCCNCYADRYPGVVSRCSDCSRKEGKR